MRLSADWMSLADERILEFLSEQGPRSPTKIVESGLVRFTRPHVNKRCQKLESYGLLQNIGNGVYMITDKGEEYLAGELDASELENQDD